MIQQESNSQPSQNHWCKSTEQTIPAATGRGYPSTSTRAECTLQPDIHQGAPCTRGHPAPGGTTAPGGTLHHCTRGAPCTTALQGNLQKVPPTDRPGAAQPATCSELCQGASPHKQARTNTCTDRYSHLHTGAAQPSAGHCTACACVSMCLPLCFCARCAACACAPKVPCACAPQGAVLVRTLLERTPKSDAKHPSHPTWTTSCTGPPCASSLTSWRSRGLTDPAFSANMSVTVTWRRACSCARACRQCTRDGRALKQTAHKYAHPSMEHRASMPVLLRMCIDRCTQSRGSSCQQPT